MSGLQLGNCLGTREFLIVEKRPAFKDTVESESEEPYVSSTPH